MLGRRDHASTAAEGFAFFVYVYMCCVHAYVCMCCVCVYVCVMCVVCVYVCCDVGFSHP